MTPDDAARITELRATGMTWLQVAGEMGVTLETLRVWRHTLGLPVPQRARIMPHGWPTPRMRAIEAEYDEPLRDVITGFRAIGYDWPTIAGALDMSERQLYVWRKRLGLPVPRRGGNNARLAN